MTNPAEAAAREIKVLETAEDIQARRDEVLGRYAAFKAACRDRKHNLEDSRRYQYFKRDADELESWILEKLQTASDESYKDPTNLQVCLILLYMVKKYIAIANELKEKV